MGCEATDTAATKSPNGGVQHPRGVGSRMSRWLVPVLIFVIALGLRLAPLNRYVTPDEPVWVYRSFRFSQALSRGDFGAIPDTGHPGVTTMWLGSLGLQIHRWFASDEATAHLDWLDGLAGLSPQNPAAFPHLAFFLPAGRVLVALVTSLGVVGIYLLISRLWGRSVAAWAALLLVLDPFLVGHGGLLHLDGMLATLMLMSVLTALLAVFSFLPAHSSAGNQGSSAATVERAGTALSPFYWVVLSGLFAGLALLTKIPGGFLAPFTVFLFIAAWLTRRVSWRQAILACALWALVAGLIFVLLYPALWGEPVATLRSVFEVGERHVEGAIRPIFFRGQVTYEPGATFYPVVWLFRVSPLVLIGLPAAFGVYLRRPGPRHFAIGALVAFSLGFGLLVTFAGKKHDRYLLPAFLPLTLVAALGWDAIGRLVATRLSAWKSATESRIPYVWLVPVALLLVQLALLAPYISTPLGYFNPLVGGPRAALKWLEVGWGEGLGGAAEWLNQKSDAEAMIVAAASVPPFASYFYGQTVPLNDQTVYQADFIVQPTRQGLVELNSELETSPTVYEEWAGGIVYASVIYNPFLDEQVAFLNDRVRAGDLIILDDRSALVHAYDGPADLAVLSGVRDAAGIAANLDALVPGHESLWLVASPNASAITVQHIQRQLACRGRFINSEAVAGITISHFTQSDSIACEVTVDAQRAVRYGETLGLVDVYLPTFPIAWPSHLPIVVRWNALMPAPADYRVSLHLKDKGGRVWASGGQEILDTDYRRPSAWSTGSWSDQTFQLILPAGVPPGDYDVEMGVFDPVSGRALSAWDADGDFAGLSVELGQVPVAPPSQPPTPWDMVIGERLNPSLTAGPFNLLGYATPADQVASGDRVTFDLFWQAQVAPGEDYALRWQLYSSGGDIGLSETVSMSPYPTSRWRVQELEQVRYDLPIAPELPAGSYVLTVNLLDNSGAQLLAEDVVLATVEIVARDRLFSLPADIVYPLDLTLGNTVHLRGFDMDTLSALPGDQLPLTLYWQADGPTDLSYTVFVHLVGPDGMVHGQLDHPPAGGVAPTHTWLPGQVIVDEFSLPVWSDAPSGTYHVAVGLYDLDAGVRLPAYDAAGDELPNQQILLPIEVTVE